MKKVYLTILTICLCIFAVSAQNQQKSIVVRSAQGTEQVIDLPEGMVSQTDSLYLDWISKHYIDLGENCKASTSGPVVNDSVYMSRLKRIPAIIEMPFNEITKKFIEMYANRLRDKVAFMLSANNLYMPIIEEALELYELPLELKYLPVIESAMNPMATSPQGAVGLWQFMLRTGQLYGLKTNSLVDERRDPVKASRAAARYLKDLYAIYQDWNLVLAAYNCGPGTINKAIRRAGGETDFWKIYNYLPKETRGYVPAFVAANYIMTYYCEHNISPLQMRLPEGTDTIRIQRNLNLNQIAGVCKIDVEQLRALNPDLRKDIVPGDVEPYDLHLPNNMISCFIDNQEAIFSYKADEYNTRRATVEVEEQPVKSKKGRTSSRGQTTYTIKNGDTLGGIASKFGVSVKQLRRLNGIKGTNIRAGKRIRIR